MSSTQDLDSRLGVIERKLDFLFKLMTFTKQTKTGLLDEHGHEQIKMEQITMEALYRDVTTSGGLVQVSHQDA